MSIRGGVAGSEAGVVLVNVLVMIAIGSAAVALMLSAQERALRSAVIAAGATQAEALALGAESSARSALRRDMLEAPEEDHLGEAWASILQEPVSLATGRFEVAVEDARGRFDVNALVQGNALDLALLVRLAAVLDLPEQTAPRIAARMARDGLVRDVGALKDAGLPPGVLERLVPHLSALPRPGPINLNAVTPELMAAIVQNPGAARRLLARRASSGRLTPDDLDGVRVLMPAGAGFTSDLFDVSVRAEAGGAALVLVSRLLRTDGPEGPRVWTVHRRIGDAP